MRPGLSLDMVHQLLSGVLTELPTGRALGYGLLVLAWLGVAVAFWLARAPASEAPAARPPRGEFRRGFAAVPSPPVVVHPAPARRPAVTTVTAASDFAGNPVIARLRQRWQAQTGAVEGDHGSDAPGE